MENQIKLLLEKWERYRDDKTDWRDYTTNETRRIIYTICIKGLKRLIASETGNDLNQQTLPGEKTKLPSLMAVLDAHENIHGSDTAGPEIEGIIIAQAYDIIKELGNFG